MKDSKEMHMPAKVAQVIKDRLSGIDPMERGRLDHWERKLRVMQSEELKKVHEMIRKYPDQFAQLLCEAVLGIAREGVDNPFAQQNDGKLEHVIEYKQRAEIVLAKLEGTPLFEKNSEFVSLKDLIANRWNLKSDPYWPRFDSPHPRAVVCEFFEQYEEELGWATMYTLEVLNEGMPLYQKSDDETEFSLVPFSSEEYIYLKLKGKLEFAERVRGFPEWSRKYFMKQEHIAAHKIFFKGHSDKEDEVAILRAAFQRHIGVEPGRDDLNPAARRHRTRLLDLVDAVATRYYGSNFNPLNSDTWPSQDQITNWLATEHGLTGRQASAVEIVARPDETRRK